MTAPVELRGKRVLVVGLARTGVATALFCAGRGAVVTATDSRPAAELAEAAAKLTAAGVTLAAVAANVKLSSSAAKQNSSMLPRSRSSN